MSFFFPRFPFKWSSYRLGIIQMLHNSVLLIVGEKQLERVVPSVQKSLPDHWTRLLAKKLFDNKSLSESPLFRSEKASSAHQQRLVRTLEGMLTSGIQLVIESKFCLVILCHSFSVNIAQRNSNKLVQNGVKYRLSSLAKNNCLHRCQILDR
jgi:hypothetical protein